MCTHATCGGGQALGQDESLSPENAMYRWASWEFSLMSAKPPELDVLSWSLGVEPGLETAPPKARHDIIMYIYIYTHNYTCVIIYIYIHTYIFIYTHSDVALF